MSEKETPVRVAAGIIHKNGKVLLCQRKPGAPLELLWEFPGGKAFEYEAIEQALSRELNEELGIAIREVRPVYTTRATYGSASFDVTFFIVDKYAGAVTNYEFHNLAWVPPKDLERYKILDGNKEIIEQISNGTIPLSPPELEDEL